MASNEAEGVLVAQHTRFDERAAAAKLCTQNLGMTIPTLVDGMDNAVSEAFAAWPERMYIINAEGKMHYCGGPGPFDFNPQEARESLMNLLETE
jgi:hypothetical protein